MRTFKKCNEKTDFVEPEQSTLYLFLVNVLNFAFHGTS